MKQSGITDVKEAILEAQAEMMELVRDVMMEAVLPKVKLEARKMWQSMPDEMKERFKAERPTEYADLMKG